MRIPLKVCQNQVCVYYLTDYFELFPVLLDPASLNRLSSLHFMPILVSIHSSGSVNIHTRAMKVKHHPRPILVTIISIIAVPAAPIIHLTRLLAADTVAGLCLCDIRVSI